MGILVLGLICVFVPLPSSKSPVQATPLPSLTPLLPDIPTEQPVLPTVIELPRAREITFHTQLEEDCQTPDRDGVFIGTEEVSFVTCLTAYEGIRDIYLVATKPLTSKLNTLEGNLELYEVALHPEAVEQMTEAFYARYSLERQRYMGVSQWNQEHPFSGAEWELGGFSPGEERYIYLNRTGVDSLDFIPGESVLRWRVGQVVSADRRLQIEWRLQILDITFLQDVLMGGEGLEKELAFYVRTDQETWQGPVFSLLRRGDFLYTGVENAKDHTLIKNGKYYLASMRSDTPLTYLQYSFDLSLTASGFLELLNFQPDPFLNPDFDLAGSSAYCRLSAPYLLPEGDHISFYFTLFGREGTQNCTRLGKQVIYLTEARESYTGLALSTAHQVVQDARDPFVFEQWLHYVGALTPVLRARHLLDGQDVVVFDAATIWPESAVERWPESPSIVRVYGQDYLFFSARTTHYLTPTPTGNWTYQGPLSIPRMYRWPALISGEIRQKFYGVHWAAEFLETEIEGRPVILTSFMSVSCEDITAGICRPYPISLGFLNFDVYGHPYLAVSPMSPPVISE